MPDKTIGEILDDDPDSGVYDTRDGKWWFGWRGKDWGPFDSHEEATEAMQSLVDEAR